MQHSRELWKFIEEWGYDCQVSNFGRVRSVDRVVNHNKSSNKKRNCKGRVFPSFINKKTGYLNVHFLKNGIRKTIDVHRLVAIAFCDNPKWNKYVNHIDGNKLNNHSTNLEWVTNSENIIHSFKMLGRKIHNSKRILTLDGKSFDSISKAMTGLSLTKREVYRGLKNGSLHQEMQTMGNLR